VLRKGQERIRPFLPCRPSSCRPWRRSVDLYGTGLERRSRGQCRVGVRTTPLSRGTPFSSQTPGSRVTDFQPAVRDNGDLIGAVRSVPSPKTALEAAPNPFSALFD